MKKFLLTASLVFSLKALAIQPGTYTVGDAVDEDVVVELVHKSIGKAWMKSQHSPMPFGAQLESAYCPRASTCEVRMPGGEDILLNEDSSEILSEALLRAGVTRSIFWDYEVTNLIITPNHLNFEVKPR
jgi:hypothetical protein